MKHTLVVALFCGGQSAEYEVSLRSAYNVWRGLVGRYDIKIIEIAPHGAMYLRHEDWLAAPTQDEGQAIGFMSTAQGFQFILDDNLVHIDVAFPVVHGPKCEDGSLQGLFKSFNIPFVGADVLGSAVGMDKDVMKRLLKAARLPVLDMRVLDRLTPLSFQQASYALGLPMFIKPASMGSSIGVSKVSNEIQYNHALQAAFEFDHKIIIEPFIDAREIECAVLGNEQLRASLPGRLDAQHSFYSYEAKYIDPNGAHFEIPASLSAELVEQIQNLSIEACQALCCEGMARVDFFLGPDQKLYINEINTLPGFTEISMYPKLWEVSGVPLTALLDSLIHLALARFDRGRALRLQV